MHLILQLAIPTLMSAHGYRKRSLSVSGAMAAFTVGYLTMSIKLHIFFVTLLAFYLLGSRVTKIGKNIKEALEDGHDAGGGGYRNAWQVFCNAHSAVVCALLWDSLFNPRTNYPLGLLRHMSYTMEVPFDPQHWCAVGTSSVAESVSRKLVLSAIAQFACCLGDTFASELGILARSPPRLITTFKVVPSGTNGAISAAGVVASLAGGAIIGFVAFICLLIENSACRQSALRLAIELVILGTLAGGLGSTIDSLLGATLQQTRYSASIRKILQDNTSSRDYKVVSGVNVLTNNQVNFISSLAISLAAAWAG